MVTKQKVILSVVMIVLTTLFVGFSIYSVFASPTQNVTSDFTVNYLAPSIDAKMCAKYAVDGGTETSFVPYNESGSVITGTNNYLVFKNNATDSNVGSLRISSAGTFKSTVVIKFEFVNTGSVKFKVSLTSSSTLENATMEYSLDGATYNSTIPTSEEVSTNANKNYTKYFYVKATVTESALAASFKPAFNWKIEKVQ